MITNIEERKSNLKSQLENLKREIEALKWPDHKEPVVRCYTDSFKYSSPDILQENSGN